MTHTETKVQTLSAHLEELRRRLLVIVTVFGLGGVVAYRFHQQIIDILRAPLGDTLYFSSPGGGFNFVLKVCILVGFLAASPVIVLRIMRFVEPVLPSYKRLALLRYMAASVVLLAAGVAFGYFVTLPAALHFLGHFGGENVQALISVNEYMNFVMAYLAGFGLLFQLPLIILFINRVKPLSPKSLFRASKYVILGAFIVAAILTPTPDPVNQGLMAGPLIGMYGFSIGLVAISNKHSARRSRRSPSQPYIPRQPALQNPATAPIARTFLRPAPAPQTNSPAATQVSLRPKRYAMDIQGPYNPIATTNLSPARTPQTISHPKPVAHPNPQIQTVHPRLYMDIRPV